MFIYVYSLKAQEKYPTMITKGLNQKNNRSFLPQIFSYLKTEEDIGSATFGTLKNPICFQ